MSLIFYLRSREIGILNYPIALKFDMHVGSNAADVPGKLQSDRTILNTNLAASAFCEFLRLILYWNGALVAVSIRKTVLPGMATPMLKIRRPNGRLIFNMEITIRR